MVSDPFLVGVFYGFVPAMGFLYILLHRYEGLFNERRVFFAFLLGIAGGLVSTLLLVVLLGSAAQTHSLPAFVPLFGLAEALIFAMALNSRKFRRKPDTPFHGVAFGLGFGAMSVLFLIGYAVNNLQAVTAIGLTEILSLTLLGIFLIATILFHGTVGAWIGRGAAHGGLPMQIFKGAALEAAAFSLFFLLFTPELAKISYAIPFLTLGLGLFLVHYVLTSVLDPILPPEIRREMDVHRRRVARRVQRESSQPTGTDPAEARTAGSPEEGAEGLAPPNP